MSTSLFFQFIKFCKCLLQCIKHVSSPFTGTGVGDGGDGVTLIDLIGETGALDCGETGPVGCGVGTSSCL